MKLPRCQYKSECKMQRLMKHWLENPKNKRPLTPIFRWRLGRLTLGANLGWPHRKVIWSCSGAQLVYVTRCWKEPRTWDAKKSPRAGPGCGQGSWHPVTAPRPLPTDGYSFLTTKALLLWKTGLWTGFVKELPSFVIYYSRLPHFLNSNYVFKQQIFLTTS